MSLLHGQYTLISLMLIFVPRARQVRLFLLIEHDMPLPPELINYIFSFLREDTAALNACSRAYPLFSRLAERHLYTDIVVRLSDQPVLSELCNQLANNARILRYPRTLKIIGVAPFIVYPSVLPIISMIPRMVNLFSFCFYGGTLLSSNSGNQRSYEVFISTLRYSLQQSSIKQFCHHRLVCFPTVAQGGITEESPSNPRWVQSLEESLVITGLYNQEVLFWATHQGPHLMSLRNTSMLTDLSTFSELLTACSNSLTSLHINLGSYCMKCLSLSI
jgi:hypothetical protein